MIKILAVVFSVSILAGLRVTVRRIVELNRALKSLLVNVQKTDSWWRISLFFYWFHFCALLRQTDQSADQKTEMNQGVSFHSTYYCYPEVRGHLRNNNTPFGPTRVKPWFLFFPLISQSQHITGCFWKSGLRFSVSACWDSTPKTPSF